MPTPVAGIHHVTAISGPAQRNLDFYAGLLGLRLVKRTVNFDDPYVYHFYFGDEEGRPGTIMTTFPWENAVQGKAGRGMVTTTAFSVPNGAIDGWMERLADQALEFGSPEERFGKRVLPLTDPDGMQVELVEDGSGDGLDVSSISSVTMASVRFDDTMRLLVDELGYAVAGEEGTRTQLKARSGKRAASIEVDTADAGIGRMSAGVVHHVAFRVQTEADQVEWREHLLELGYNVSEVRDRQYFKSIYFREPGGVLFEIATDAPGFLVDEMPEQLGTSLKLPPWLEPRRKELELRLPTIQIPS